jgi:hypothetical protein
MVPWLLSIVLLWFSHESSENRADYKKSPFSLDSASAYLKTLCVDIGSRPMGSPGEQRAMRYAVSKFKEFGLSEAYIMPMRSAVSYSAGGVVNTTSGVAVGTLKGKTGRIIVLGAHIDSSEPEGQGANDDASGSAVILELARVLAERENESTIVFALFGGEEEGLQGSRHFVNSFPQIDSVKLMLQVDMANGSDWILPLVDSRTGSTPRWLVQAAYEEFSNLGYTGLSFPTHLMTFSGMLGGAIGSDHVQFLERGIPAIDFTTDVNDPIHTPQDTFENFRVWGLQRSGDLVYRLVERFDNSVPETGSDFYFLFDIGSIPVFVPFWLLWAVLVVATAMAAYVFISHVKEPKPVHSPKYSGWKLFLCMLIIQAFVWLSENVVGLIKGERFPWLTDMSGYFALGFIAGCLGIWVCLHLTPRLRISTWRVGHYNRSAGFLLLFMLLLLPVSLKAAIAPASALFLLSLAFVIRQPALRLLFWLVSPYLMFRLTFTEGFELFARSFVLGSHRDITTGIILHLLYILFFSLWAFPFLSGFAALSFRSGSALLSLNHIRKRRGLVVSLIAFFALVTYLVLRSSTDRLWKPQLTVTQQVDLQTGHNTTTISSTEYLGDTRFSVGVRDTSFSRWATSGTIAHSVDSSNEWLQSEISLKADDSASRLYRLTTHFRMKHRPYRLKIIYAVRPGPLERFESPYELSLTSHSATLRWYAFPDTALVVPMSLKIAPTDTLTEHIEAVFSLPFETVSLSNFSGNLRHRTFVSRSIRLYP